MSGHHLNDTERRLRDRWNSPFGPSLRSIEISANVPLRGISGVTVDLKYPLVVIAGKNGTGKSTFLACAACSYRNTGNFESFFFRKKYFNFNDFFVNSPVDLPMENVSIKWTYRRSDRTIAFVNVSKGNKRWAGYRNRLERPVEFLGLMRALHPTELRTLRNQFGGSVTMTPISMSTSSKELVSSVMTRNYNNLQCATEGKYSLHVLNSGDACYSGFNAGSGEDIACLISRVIERLPEDGLLIIEEIETGLHPAAQRQIIKILLEQCYRKKLQVICSSHSQTILESVPSDARILLERFGPLLQPRYGVSVAEAMSDMCEIPVIELCVYVEDEVAKLLVLECLPAELRQRIRVIDCGSWDDVIRFVTIFRRDQALGNVIGILDGDRNSCDTEHRRVLSKYLNGNATDDDWSWLKERLLCLPGNESPEYLFFQYGQEQEYRSDVAAELNAAIPIIDNFFSSFNYNDTHCLPFELSQRVGLEEQRVLFGLARASCKYKASEFEIIVDFIRRRLDETE